MGSDAVHKIPTVAEEMAKFQGFSTTDGEISDGKPTAEETARVAAAAAQKVADSKVAKKNELQRPAAKTEQERAAAAADAAEEEHAEEIPANETPEEKTAREAKAAKQQGLQKRIDKAVGRQRSAERALAAEREERARERGAFEARLQALEKGDLTKDGEKSKTAFDPNEPRSQDYEYGELDNKYIRDLARYEARKEFASEQTKTKAESVTAEQKAAKAEFEKAKATFESAGAEKFDDFDEVVTQTFGLPVDDPDFWPCSQTMGELLLTSDVGPDIAYHLATNIKEAKEVFQMSPAKQAAWFGRQEAKIPAESQAAADETAGADDATKNAAAIAKTTKAPPPLNTKVKGGGGKPQTSPDSNDFKAFEAMAMGGK